MRERRVRRVGGGGAGAGGGSGGGGGGGFGGAAAKSAPGDITLVEALDRVLERGVVAQAEVVISVAEIPLIYVGAQALVTSVERATRLAQELHLERSPRA